jgi:indolepyruvate ferredoxin oxidoreductase alpha subunit
MQKRCLVKELLSGNEAIARGAFECGVRFAAGYPGTPSTEIMESFAKYPGVYAQWSPNEKVAMEVCIGAAMAGAKALAVMKHVGVNVAADPLFTVSYTGTNGALVIVTADDPSMHSSQNEQDNRNYARFAKIPMLEPADSQEAREYVKLAFAISERFDTPVFLRSNTRISHSKSVVTSEDAQTLEAGETGIRFDAEKYVMVPMNARKRRVAVEQRMAKILAVAETFPENRIEINSTDVGIITSGISYHYAKEAFPDYSYLKLGMVYPLPAGMIRAFASKVRRIYVVEELDPFLEEQIRALGIDVTGKEIFPAMGEFNPGIVEQAVSGQTDTSPCTHANRSIPLRPPNLCPGCPHRGLFYVLGKLKVFVTGDIGCYTLSFMKPLQGLHTCICMGASIGMAHGMSKVLGEKGRGKIVGVIGDSTFLHSGITPLLDMVYNKSDAVIVICDNSTTAMTGMQEHPATGYTLQGVESSRVDLMALVKTLGVENISVVDPYDLRAVRNALKMELGRSGPSVIISRRPCVLFKREKKTPVGPLLTSQEKCTGCRLCLGLGCPAIAWQKSNETGEPSKKRDGWAVIDQKRCTACGICAQLCKSGAIREEN